VIFLFPFSLYLDMYCWPESFYFRNKKKHLSTDVAATKSLSLNLKDFRLVGATTQREIHEYMQTYINTNVHTHMHTCINNTYTHTNMRNNNTYTHTHLHV